ncbi:MAG: hypothetical protein ACLPVO_19315 [Desulfomonilaceae bacterium]
MKVIVAAIIFTLLPVVSFTSDSSSQVRDRYGNITRTERHEGRQKIIRDRNENIIGTEDVD